MEQDIKAALWLQRVAALSTAQIVSLWRQFGSFSAALAADDGALGELLPADVWQRLRRCRDQTQLDIPPADQPPAAGVELLVLGDPAYPVLLRDLHCPPPLLYVRGDRSLLSLPQLAVVGARRHTVSGGETARAFARELTRGGFTITSGLALGIDGMAHRGALEVGKTIAVLGTGVEQIYPKRHRELAAEIVAGGGVLVSEMPANTPPLPAYFPQRNRIISGLSLGVLVVEAARQSGSLITARCAMEQGREVFAIPGSIHSPVSHGCHQLIRDGATLVECVEDIAAQLGGMLAFKRDEAAPAPESLAPPSRHQQQLLDQLGFDPVDFDALLARTGLATPALTSALLDLELAGWLAHSAGRYQRVR